MPHNGLLANVAGGVLRISAAALLAVYLVWQVAWLVQGRVPPALYWGLTGLPAPTTGGLRAMICLLRGEWLASLRWNPLAVPMAGLFLATLVAVAWEWVARRRVNLARGWLWAWLGMLALAWAVQSCLAAVGGMPQT